MNLNENINRIKELMGIIIEEEQNDTQNNILYPLSTGGAKTLILLPGAGENGGQGDSDFKELATNLGSDFSIYTANFPNELDVREYTQEIVDEINNNPNIRSFAVGGFSIGGAMAWHLSRLLKDEKVEKFINKLFFIDSGIPNSTEEFAEGIVKGNTPRLAFAIPVGFLKKARSGENLTKEEEKSVKSIYTETGLADFKEKNNGNYIEYIGKDFPPANTKLDADAKTKNEENPDEVYVIEDKYDTTEFDVRYSVMPKEVKSMAFKEGDVIVLRNFVEQDTLKKKGLGRELPDGGVIGPLDGVEVISLVAGKKKEGIKTSEEIDAVKLEVNNATTNANTKVEVVDAQHSNITKSKELADKIRELY